LKFDEASCSSDSSGLHIVVENPGQTFVRNIVVGLFNGRTMIESKTIALLKPVSKTSIRFEGDFAKQAKTSGRHVVIDSTGRIIEGGASKSNNALYV
jgi:hypothetical protein